MSIWVEVKGSLKGDKLSVRRAITEFFDEVSISQVEPEVIFSYTGEGVSAVAEFEKFLQHLKSRFEHVRYDFDVTVRFLW